MMTGPMSSISTATITAERSSRTISPHDFSNESDLRETSPLRKRIFYGVAGEGLGHASRALAVVDHLPDCEIHLFTFGKAYEFFQEMGYPYLHEIEGMLFSYRRGRVNYPRTLANSVSYWLRGMRRNLERIETLNRRLQPDLFITDFEPSVIRAAHRLGIPVLSLDNQHKFAYCKPGPLPWFLRTYVRCTGFAVRRLIPHPTHAIISTFHADRLEVTSPNVTLTGGILRKDVEQIPASNAGFVLVYLRDSVGDRILNSIRNCGREVRVYGANLTLQRKYADQFDFFPLSPAFIHDLAWCDRIVATAGNQLISECRYYGKPMLVVPEPGQYEQSVNAHYVEQIELGRRCEADALTTEFVREFLNRGVCRARRIPNGIHDAIRVISSMIGERLYDAERQDAVSV